MGVSVNPLNTLVGMTRGVGYFVKEVEPPNPPPTNTALLLIACYAVAEC